MILEKYNILHVFDLVSYDENFPALYQKLKEIKKPIYLSNEKIVILHNDTEYFYYDQKIGFTIHNLLGCWQQLDIPWHVLIIITNHYGYEEIIRKYYNFHLKDSLTIKFSMVNSKSYKNIKSLLNNPDENKQPTKFALGLYGGTVRSHRTAFVKWLEYKKLTEKILLSYNASYHNQENQFTNKKETNNKSNTNINTNKNYNFVTANLHRINENFLTNNYCLFSTWIDQPLGCYQDNNLLNNPVTFYSRCFLDIVSETTFAYPYPFISEKTLRPIILKTPFILFASPGTLHCLREHGFKTFVDFWDESYDNISDHGLRFLKICSIIEQLANLTVTEYQNMYDSMIPILTHNQKHFYNYLKNVYNPIYSCLETNDSD